MVAELFFAIASLLIKCESAHKSEVLFEIDITLSLLH